MILSGDLHLQPSTRDVVIKVLDTLLDAAADSQDPRIGLLGDIFMVRHKIPVVLLNVMEAWLCRCRARGVTVWMIPGNHDQVATDGANALEVFALAEHVMVYSEPTWTPDGLWVPYLHDFSPLEELCAAGIPEGSAPVVFGHLPIRDAQMTASLKDVTGIPVGMFKHFRRINILPISL